LPAADYSRLPEWAKKEVYARGIERASDPSALDRYLGPELPAFNPQPRHLAAMRLLAGPARHVMLVGGSRSGKTVLIVREILRRAIEAPGSRHAILRFRANAARSSIWLDTLPHVARDCFPRLKLRDHRIDGYVELEGIGSEIWIGGLDEKARVEKILGQEFSTIYLNEASQIPQASRLVALTRLAQTVRTRDGGWLPQKEFDDLNPVGKGHWTYQLYVLNVDPDSKRPVDKDEYAYMFLSPEDNAANLSSEYIAAQRALPDRYRRRFYEGVYVDEVEGALWTMEALDHARCDSEDVPETMDRLVVAVDPSGTEGDEETRSDEVGIVVVGRSAGVAYLLRDLTVNEPPERWARIVIAAYREFGADRIVAEANYGGAMVRAVIDAAARGMGVVLPPVEVVKATRNKAVRAEPASVLYGFFRDGAWHQDRVRHVGEFPKLEEQLLNFSTAGYVGQRSPDRADALIWALQDIMMGEQPPAWSRGRMELVA
jgi:hypothetical protein